MPEEICILEFKFEHSNKNYNIKTSFYVSVIGASQKRQWHPTPVLLPGKSHAQRILVGCSPWGL